MISAPRPCLALLLAFGLLAAPALAEDQPTCAILPFNVLPSVRGTISLEDITLLTDRFSAELTRLAYFRVVDSDFREAARVRGGAAVAQKYIKGTIGMIGETITINTRVVNAQNGIIDLQVFTDFKGSLDHLLTVALRENAEALVHALHAQSP